MAKPTIRFRGFDDEWEQRKLSEIALQTYGGGTPKTANEEFWKGNIPWIQSSDLIEERLFNVKPRKYISQEAISKSATKLVPQNSIAIVTRVGVGKLAFMPFSYATSQDFLSLSELKIEPEFAVYALYKMMQLVSNEVQGTSIKGITKDELLAKEILIPDCEEQKKIGAYLHTLDSLITLHQRKCDETKKLKKYMLQKMFPQNGSKVPEIRFKGFTDEWEQRKLGEVAQELKSGNSLKADVIDITGDYPVYGGNGLRGYTSIYNHDGEYALIGRQGALCGNMNYSVGKAYFTEHAVVVKADENNDTRFLYYMLDTMNLGQYSDQSAQPGLAVNKLVKLENQFPTKEEQQRMGWYFSNIDNLITLHQHKCEELKKLKKFMLQNMFTQKNK